MNFLNQTRVIRFLVVLIVIGSFCAGSAAQDQPANLKTFLLERMRKRRIPGLQLAVVRGGKIVLLESLGTANIEDHVPVTSRTVFSINSATKAFTGTAIVQLAASGKLDLEASISAYLDNLPAAWQPIKVRQLLTHVSGLPDVLTFTKGQGTGMLLGDGGEASAWDAVRRLPLDFPTGEKYRYNQTNYILLGKIIDKLSRQPFTAFIKSRQFDPVGMPQTAFGDSRDVVMHRAQAYRYPQGRLTASAKGSLERAFDEFSPFLRTGAGLNSTAEEIARWIIALESNRLLGRSELTRLWSPGTFNNNSPTPWALGWVAMPRPKHRAVAGIGGRRSTFFVYPEDDTAIVILTNLAGANPEEFIDEIAGFYIPDLANGGALAPATKLLRTALLKNGFTDAGTTLAKLKRENPQFEPPENELNNWGGQLMSEGDLKEAVEVFKLNVALYPASANTYDSLAEAYELSGEKTLAIANYRRSLELDPQNTNAAEHLAKLEPEK